MLTLFQEPAFAGKTSQQRYKGVRQLLSRRPLQPTARPMSAWPQKRSAFARLQEVAGALDLIQHESALFLAQRSQPGQQHLGLSVGQG